MRFPLNEGFVLDTTSGDIKKEENEGGWEEVGEGAKGKERKGEKKGMLRMLLEFRFVGSRIYNIAFTFLLYQKLKGHLVTNSQFHLCSFLFLNVWGIS